MPYDITIRALEPRHTLVIRRSLAVSALPGFFAEAFGRIYTFATEAGVTPEEPPFARYLAVNVDRIDVEAGVTVPVQVGGSGEIEAGSLPGGDAAILEYFGPYGDMQPAYVELEKWVRDEGRQPAGSPWEVYYSDPEQEPDPQKWRTEIVMPLA